MTREEALRITFKDFIDDPVILDRLACDLNESISDSARLAFEAGFNAGIIYWDGTFMGVNEI